MSTRFEALAQGDSIATACITQVTFRFARKGKPGVAAFDIPDAISHGGLVLLKGIDTQLGLTRRLAACLEDDRQPAKVRHQAIELVRPRVFGLRRVVAISVAASAAGGRGDPQAQVGRDPIAGPALASQPTLSLFENAVGATLDRAPAIA